MNSNHCGTSNIRYSIYSRLRQPSIGWGESLAHNTFAHSLKLHREVDTRLKTSFVGSLEFQTGRLEGTDVSICAGSRAMA